MWNLVPRERICWLTELISLDVRPSWCILRYSSGAASSIGNCLLCFADLRYWGLRVLLLKADLTMP